MNDKDKEAFEEWELDVSEDTIVDLITNDYKKCILKALNK